MTQVNTNQNNNQGGVQMSVLQQQTLQSIISLQSAEPQAYVDMITKLYKATIVAQQQPQTVNIAGATFPINEDGNVIMEVVAVEKMMKAIQQPQQSVPQYNVNVQGTIDKNTIQQVAQTAINATEKEAQIKAVLDKMALYETKIKNLMAMGCSYQTELYLYNMAKVELDQLSGNGLGNMAMNVAGNIAQATNQYMVNNIAPTAGSVIEEAGSFVGDFLNGLLDAVEETKNAVLPVVDSVLNAGIGIGRAGTTLTTNTISSFGNTVQQQTVNIAELFNLK